MDGNDHHYETVGPGASLLHKPHSPPPPYSPEQPYDPYYTQPTQDLPMPPPPPIGGGFSDAPLQLGSQETLGSAEAVSGSKAQSRGNIRGRSDAASHHPDKWKKPCKIVFFITLLLWILFAFITFITYGHYVGLFNMVQPLKETFLGGLIPEELETLYVPI